MIPYIPNRFRDKATLDLEAVNANLRAGARMIESNRSKRYTRCEAHLDLTGVTNASAQVLRELAIRRPGASNAVEVIGVELVIFGGVVAGTATVTCSDPSFPSFTIDLSATTTVENYGSSGNAVPIPSNAADLTFTITFSGAYTVTAGQLIVHFRCDRGNQGDAFGGYVPTLIDSSDTTAVTTLQTQLTAFDDAAVREGAAQKDLRCSIFAGRNIVAGASIVFRVPGYENEVGQGDGAVPLRVDVYVVAAGTVTGRCQVSDQTVTVTTDVVGTGVAARAQGGSALTTLTGGTDPMDPLDDLLITLKNQAGAADVLLIYAVVWWR